MKAIFMSLGLTLSALSAHAVTITSQYPGGTDSSFAKCVESQTPNIDGFEQASCKVTQEMGDYAINEIFSEHTTGLDLLYKGESLDLWGDGSGVPGVPSTKFYKLAEGYEIDWHNGGVGPGSLEVRSTVKYVKGKPVYNPFAIIYREVQYTFAAKIDADGMVSSPEVIASESNSLVVVKLDGANSRAIGQIDALKSKKANEQARQCADSIVGQGDASLCTSTLEKDE